MRGELRREQKAGETKNNREGIGMARETTEEGGRHRKREYLATILYSQ